VSCRISERINQLTIRRERIRGRGTASERGQRGVPPVVNSARIRKQILQELVEVFSACEKLLHERVLPNDTRFDRGCHMVKMLGHEDFV
jgi:hypothetical protein